MFQTRVQTRVLPASLCIAVAILLVTGLYFNDRADAADDETPVSDRGQETYVERAVRTRAGELIKRIDTDQAQECTCPP